jgi:hypothetical protein
MKGRNVMLRKLWVGFAVLALGILMAVPVMAQTASGTGRIIGEGNGRAQIQCRTCDVSISGSGVLMILDRDGTVEIGIEGIGTSEVREMSWGRLIIYRGFNGSALISGESVGVVLRGRNITLDATGTGRVWLRGEGTYTANGVNGEWSEDGEAVDFGAGLE